MSNKEQTSVEWLVWELNKLGFFPNGVPQEIYEQAKQIHKQEIIDSHVAGHNAPSSTVKFLDAKEYYQQTFNQETK